MWMIETQIEKIGKIEREVNCKKIRFFPTEGGGGETTFGMFKFLIFKVILVSPVGDKYEITWSNYSGTPLTQKDAGKFKIKFPDMMTYPVVVQNGRTYTQWWEKPIVSKGETQEFTVHERFVEWLNKRCPAIANEVMGEFYARIIKEAQKQAAKLAVA